MGRSVFVTLGAAVNGYVSSMRESAKATRDLAQATEEAGRKGELSLQQAAAAAQKDAAARRAALDDVARGTAIAGAALTGIAVAAVKSYADFDEAISHVKATGQDAVQNITSLREAALQAGADTAFSATEAAGGVEELAKAGVSAADILGGGLRGSLDLAASGGLGVGEAAEIAATALTQFKLEGRDVGHVADLLAAGASEAQGGVGDLGAALKQTGLVANQTGLSIEETVAGLSAFASAGLIGSDAGTSFKSMLQRLTPQSQEAAEEMERLGISAYDSQGQFIGLSAFADNLRTSMQNLTPEQRNASMAIIFGSDAVRAANVLYEQGGAGIDSWTEKVDQSGFAAETAATRMDNLKGDVEQLGGALETALINLGEGGNGPLRSVTQAATELVNKFSEAPDWIQSATLAIIGGSGLALLGAAGVMKVVTATSDAIEAMKTLGILSETTAGKMGRLAGNAAKVAGAAAGIAAAFAAVAALTNALTDRSTVDGNAVAQALADARDNGEALNAVFQDYGTLAGQDLGADIDSLGAALNRTFNRSTTDKVNDTAASILSFTGAVDTMELLDERFAAIDTELANMVSSGNLEGAFLSFREIKNEAAGLGIPLDELREKFPEYMSAVQGATTATESATPAQEEYNAAMDTGGASAAQYAAAVAEATETQNNQTNALLSARDASRQYEAAVDEAAAALAENGATLDINTAAGRANQAALDNITGAHLANIEQMRNNGATQAELQAATQRTREDFINAATAFGMSADEANRLADDMNLIPANVTPTVQLNDQASGKIDEVGWKLDRLDGRVITTNLVTKETVITTGIANQRAMAGGGEVPLVAGASWGRDSVNILGMPGEHMLTVADVRAMGGQAAVYDFRRNLHNPTRYSGNTQPRRYANGGSVGQSNLAGLGSRYGSTSTVTNTSVLEVKAAGEVGRRSARAIVDALMDRAAVSPGVWGAGMEATA